MLPGKINTLVILSSHTRITPDEKLMSYRAKIRRSHGENRLLSKKTLRGLTLHPRGYITSIKDWLQKCSQNFESIWKAYKTQSSKSEFGVITLNWLEKLTIKFFFHGINMGSLLCFFFYPRWFRNEGHDLRQAWLFISSSTQKIIESFKLKLGLAQNRFLFRKKVANLNYEIKKLLISEFVFFLRFF